MTFTMALPAARKGVIAVPFRQRVVFREEETISGNRASVSRWRGAAFTRL